jgi:ribosomal protein S6--L-glutamate ligase
MHIILLTRFHSNHSNSAFTSRLAEESVKAGHQLTIINPAEVVLKFMGSRASDFPVFYNNKPFPEADLILPSARWDDTHNWQVAETLQAWQRPVVLHNRVPLGDHVTMARLYARRQIPSPRTWVLSQPMQLAIVLPEIRFPCIMRSRYGGAGRRLAVVQHSGEIYSLAEQLSNIGQPFMIQDLPEPVGEDIRVLVIGDKIGAAIHRRGPEGFVRPRESGNTHVYEAELTDEERKIVLAAAELYGAPFCTVSIVRTDKGSLLLEVARAPTLDEMEGATKHNLAAEIIVHLARLAEQTRARVVPLAPRMPAAPQ